MKCISIRNHWLRVQGINADEEVSQTLGHIVLRSRSPSPVVKDFSEMVKNMDEGADTICAQMLLKQTNFIWFKIRKVPPPNPSENCEDTTLLYDCCASWMTSISLG